MLELELQLQHGQPPLVGITTSLLSFCQSIPRTQSNSLTTFPMLNSCAKAHGSLTEPSLFAVIPLRPLSHFLFAVLLRPQCLSSLPSSCVSLHSAFCISLPLTISTPSCSLFIFYQRESLEITTLRRGNACRYKSPCAPISRKEPGG